MFPIFAKPAAKEQLEPSAFRWITPSIGPNKSCLHGVHLEPKATSKLAAFDLDGCLIESSFKNGKRTKSDIAPSFTWWRPAVPKKLKQILDEGLVHKLYARESISLAFPHSYSIVIVTNQNLRGKDGISNWKKKIPVIAASVRYSD